MFKVNKIKSYKKFADSLKQETGFNIKTDIVEHNHFHFQFTDSYGLSLGVLCVNDGNLSFAPLVTLESAQNGEYIDFDKLPQFGDLSKLFTIFESLFLENEEL